MKEFAYDWFGLNELLFRAFYAVNFDYLDSIWSFGRYAYGYMGATIIAFGLCARYLMTRHTARESEIAAIGDILVTLILSLTFVVCILVTAQNILLLPRPWEVFPSDVDVITLSPWHEGFPATNAAIAVMLVAAFWRHASRKTHSMLVIYAMIGCFTSIIVGIHFPADTLGGALVGLASVYMARYIMRLGTRIVAIP